METFHTSIHLEMDKPKEATTILIAALRFDIQEKIKEYASRYNLVLISRLVYFHINEWYMFIYLKDVTGEWARIDFQIH